MYLKVADLAVNVNIGLFENVLLVKVESIIRYFCMLNIALETDRLNSIKHLN